MGHFTVGDRLPVDLSRAVAALGKGALVVAITTNAAYGERAFALPSPFRRERRRNIAKQLLDPGDSFAGFTAGFVFAQVSPL